MSGYLVLSHWTHTQLAEKCIIVQDDIDQVNEHKVQCPHCGNYYKSRGLKTHLRFCLDNQKNKPETNASRFINNIENSENSTVHTLTQDKAPKFKKNILGKVFAIIVVTVTFGWSVFILYRLVDNRTIKLETIHLQVLSVLIAIAILIGFLSATFGKDSVQFGSKEWWKHLVRSSFDGLVTEMIGAAITFILLGLAVDVVEEARNERTDKVRLVRQLGSTDNRFALEAREGLNGYGWISDGTLSGANLLQANLQGVNLRQADLSNATLNWSNLMGADLMYANLEGTNLFAASACSINLAYSNLQGASLNGTDLRWSTLNSADLRNANLFQAKMQGAVLAWTRFNEETILPDGTRWSSERDMSNFTGPKQAWSSEFDYSLCK